MILAFPGAPSDLVREEPCRSNRPIHFNNASGLLAKTELSTLPFLYRELHNTLSSRVQ